MIQTCRLRVISKKEGIKYEIAMSQKTESANDDACELNSLEMINPNPTTGEFLSLSSLYLVFYV